MIEKIKELFAMLPRAEQLELLRELNSSTEMANPVVEVSVLSQELYGQNVKFTITTNGDPRNIEVKAELLTPWGTFEGNGINQRIAKVRAAEFAISALNDIKATEILNKE
jgi:hypothetical protein